jgi:hypothetical protein
MSLAFALWFAKTICPTNTTLIGRNQPMAHHLRGQPVGTSHLFFCMFHFFFRRQERRTERLLPCGHDHADACPCLHQLVTLMLVSEPATISRPEQFITRKTWLTGHLSISAASRSFTSSIAHPTTSRPFVESQVLLPNWAVLARSVPPFALSHILAVIGAQFCLADSVISSLR